MRYKSIHCVAHFVYFVLSGFALALSILNRKSYRPKSHCTEQLLKIWSSHRLSLSLYLSISLCPLQNSQLLFICTLKLKWQSPRRSLLRTLSYASPPPCRVLARAQRGVRAVFCQWIVRIITLHKRAGHHFYTLVMIGWHWKHSNVRGWKRVWMIKKKRKKEL